MERSPNQNLLPMRGTIEAETKRKALEAAATRAVVSGLVQVGFNAAGDYVSRDVSVDPFYADIEPEE